MRSIYEVLPRSDVLIGQFEFKYNSYGYRVSFEHFVQHFRYIRTSSVVYNKYLVQHNDAQRLTFRSSKSRNSGTYW
jgi:hypothetical protein